MRFKLRERSRNDDLIGKKVKTKYGNGIVLSAIDGSKSDGSLDYLKVKLDSGKVERVSLFNIEDVQDNK